MFEVEKRKNSVACALNHQLGRKKNSNHTMSTAPLPLTSQMGAAAFPTAYGRSRY